jgi:hypothetical protein
MLFTINLEFRILSWSIMFRQFIIVQAQSQMSVLMNLDDLEIKFNLLFQAFFYKDPTLLLPILKLTAIVVESIL